MRPRSRGVEGKSAVDVLGEATHLLRANPLLLAPYYFGSLPFILGLLYFWTDMSTGADAWRHCTQAAWGLTGLFIWMKAWQSVYARRLLARIRGEPSPPWGIRRILRVAAIQTAIQPWGMFMLPLAIIIMLPFPQAFAFFQNAALMGSGDEGELPVVLRKSWRQASLWPMQNILLIWLTSPFLLVLAAFLVFVLVPVSSSFSPGSSISSLSVVAGLIIIPLCPLGVITALNIGTALFLIPWLLKTLFDVETTFSMTSAAVLNSTFLAVVCSLSYLCLDPLLKASYCLRCFYGESLKTAEDLKVELRSPALRGSLVSIFLAAFLFFGSFGYALAEPGKGGIPRPDLPVPAQELDSAIGRIIQSPEYAWRLPREKAPEVAGEHGVLHEFLGSIFKTLAKGWNYVRGGLAKVWKFIQNILSRISPSLPKLEKSESNWTPYSRALIIIPLVGIMAVLAFLGWCAWKGRGPRAVTANHAVIPPPDLTREDLDPTALPEEGWLTLARELMEKGEFRLALRALYLGTLAFLARQDLITIARYKSDREYELELRRRSHTRPEVATLFAENRNLFESSWYGLHEVTPVIMERFSQNQESIRENGQG